jgi:hypothetical protein
MVICKRMGSTQKIILNQITIVLLLVLMELSLKREKGQIFLRKSCLTGGITKEFKQN